MKKIWLATEVEFLRQNYLTLSNQQIAEQLKRSIKSVGLKIHKLNLDRSCLVYTPTSKLCPRCNRWLSLDDFYLRTEREHRCTSACKSCVNAKNKITRQSNEYIRWQHLYRLKKYGLSEAEYNSMLLAQENLCAICKKLPGIKGLAIDHSHKTGKVRGLLCGRCNTTIGAVNEDSNILRAMIAYLGNT